MSDVRDEISTDSLEVALVGRVFNENQHEATPDGHRSRVQISNVTARTERQFELYFVG